MMITFLLKKSILFEFPSHTNRDRDISVNTRFRLKFKVYRFNSDIGSDNKNGINISRVV